MYKNNRSISGLTKGRCKFTTSDFPAENPRTQTRNYSYTKPLCVITQPTKKEILIYTNFQLTEKTKKLVRI